MSEPKKGNLSEDTPKDGDIEVATGDNDLARIAEEAIKKEPPWTSVNAGGILFIGHGPIDEEE